MTKVIGAKVAAGVVHLHTISDVKLQNAQNDSVTTGRPVLYIVNGERVEYTREELEAEMIRRETVTENYASGERGHDMGDLIERLNNIPGSFLDGFGMFETLVAGSHIVMGDKEYSLKVGGLHEEAQTTWSLTIAPYYA